MKIFKTFAFALVLCLFFSLLPVGAIATSTNQEHKHTLQTERNPRAACPGHKWEKKYTIVYLENGGTVVLNILQCSVCFERR